MKPSLCYTIWFSQRTGSNLLCAALEKIGTAGRPGEWLNAPHFLEHYDRANSADFQRRLWMMGSTANGVWGLKHSFYQPYFDDLIQAFRRIPGGPPGTANPAEVWEYVFPNHRHIFMTRRNKVRLAVSWWRAIQTEEWSRARGVAPRSANRDISYSFEAINQLYAEAVMREAGIQEFFSRGGIVPLTIVYEDFILAFEGTVRSVLDFLGLNGSTAAVPPPAHVRLADEVSEEWARRFREEFQGQWKHRGW